MPLKFCHVSKGEIPVDVFLFHGYSSSTRWQSGIAKRFNAFGYNVYACNYIGHGGRKGKKNAIFDSMIEIEKIVKRRKNPVVLIGHSIGGAIALSLGARLENVAQVFAIGAPNGKWFIDEKPLRNPGQILKAMPMAHGSCGKDNKQKFFLIHALNDSKVPIREFKDNRILFCIPKKNTLVLDGMTGVGIIDHARSMYMAETLAFIEKHIISA